MRAEVGVLPVTKEKSALPLKLRAASADRWPEERVSLSRELSQQEIDAVFQNQQSRKRDTPAVRFDFRRPDRIPKSQVRAIHLLHDTFVRNLVSSLSAYLRSYLTVNLEIGRAHV
jgi:hypothetical protein